MPVTGIFFISHNVFYPSQNTYQSFGNLSFVICQCFEFGQVQNFAVWERVNSLPDDKILDWSKLKQIADDILKCIYSEK